jgi:hypothetical protein
LTDQKGRREVTMRRENAMGDQWYYGSVEWIWTDSRIRCNLPGQPETHRTGSYQEVVEFLSHLGTQGWEVVTCVGVGDWIYWTIRYRVEPN